MRGMKGCDGSCCGGGGGQGLVEALAQLNHSTHPLGLLRVGQERNPLLHELEAFLKLVGILDIQDLGVLLYIKGFEIFCCFFGQLFKVSDHIGPIYQKELLLNVAALGGLQVWTLILKGSVHLQLQFSRVDSWAACNYFEIVRHIGPGETFLSFLKTLTRTNFNQVPRRKYSRVHITEIDVCGFIFVGVECLCKSSNICFLDHYLRLISQACSLVCIASRLQYGFVFGSSKVEIHAR
mmetsp:Transcript_4902/g.10868  ORF Transcript_4902/g.10868 Transcript_4902/m.10868 type:complete len:237 (-) Transcript_4902:20-730(-)